VVEWRQCPKHCIDPTKHEEDNMAGINAKFDKEYLDKGIDELAKAPVEALKGLSEGDAQKLKEALNIKTVKDLGTNKFFLWAQSVAKLAE
jgi:hypothetical protein